MLRKPCLQLLILALFFVHNATLADGSKELRKQQRAAQKERQVQVKERNSEISEARSDFREYTREINTEYQEKMKEIDTDFELKSVELKADHDIKIAGAEAEFQQKLTGLFMSPNAKFDEQSIEQLQAEAKALADELFTLKKQSAEEVHRERVASTKRKNELLSQRDRMALDKASVLGLTKDYAPVLATPIGDSLSKNEKNWNKKEKKKVDKLKARNRQALSKFSNGEKLRNWKIQSLNEDFKLTWDEKSELHEIDSQQTFFNTMFMLPMQGKQVDQQAFMSKIAENNKKQKLINIEYRKVREQNQIRRRNEKKDILGK